MLFSSIAIKTSIPATAPALTSGALSVSSIDVTGGTQVGAFAAATNQTLPLDTLDLRLEPGDVLAVALQTASSTATADVSLNWHEE